MTYGKVNAIRVRLGFRFSTELQTAARTTKSKQGRSNRGGISAPLDDELGRFEVRVVFAIGKKRLGATLRFKTENVRGQPLIFTG